MVFSKKPINVYFDLFFLLSFEVTTSRQVLRPGLCKCWAIGDAGSSVVIFYCFEWITLTAWQGCWEHKAPASTVIPPDRVAYCVLMGGRWGGEVQGRQGVSEQRAALEPVCQGKRHVGTSQATSPAGWKFSAFDPPTYLCYLLPETPEREKI